MCMRLYFIKTQLPYILGPFGPRGDPGRTGATGPTGITGATGEHGISKKINTSKMLLLVLLELQARLVSLSTLDTIISYFLYH